MKRLPTEYPRMNGLNVGSLVYCGGELCIEMIRRTRNKCRPNEVCDACWKHACLTKEEGNE